MGDPPAVRMQLSDSHHLMVCVTAMPPCCWQSLRFFHLSQLTALTSLVYKVTCAFPRIQDSARSSSQACRVLSQKTRVWACKCLSVPAS